MAIFKTKIGKQGRWIPALFLFFSPIILIFSVRWLLYEPFVIPSSSMEPNLLIHDHILVKKYAYGIRVPFGDSWLINFKRPERGDVIVFKYPKNEKVYFIKRLIGLPGDKIVVQNGQININGQPWKLHSTTAIEDSGAENYEKFSYFFEDIPLAQEKNHIVKFYSTGVHADPNEKTIEVPSDSYFVMGDNRDQSHDSRFWGLVNHKLLIGKASVIWLSCEDMLESVPMLCDPLKLRTNRTFKRIR